MPFPSASQSVLLSQEFYRIKQALRSSGDIAEIDVSARGIIIGPESDLAAVRMHYSSPQSPGEYESLVVSVENPFEGRLDSLNIATTATVTGTAPNRLLLTVDDFFDPSLTAAELNLMPGSSFDPVSTYLLPYSNDISGYGAINSLFIIPPVLDVIVYTQEVASLPQRRAPKTFEITRPAPNSGGVRFGYMFPYFGRRFGRVMLGSVSEGIVGVQTATMQVYGFDYVVGVSQADRPRHNQIPLGSVQTNQADTNVASMMVTTRASEDGQFDFLLVVLTLSGVGAVDPDAYNIRVDVSDTED